jgi:hypothetical protein
MDRKSGKPAFLSPLIRTAIMLISLSFGQTGRNIQSLMATLWISSQGPVGEIVGSVRIDLLFEDDLKNTIYHWNGNPGCLLLGKPPRRSECRSVRIDLEMGEI